MRVRFEASPRRDISSYLSHFKNKHRISFGSNSWLQQHDYPGQCPPPNLLLPPKLNPSLLPQSLTPTSLTMITYLRTHLRHLRLLGPAIPRCLLRTQTDSLTSTGKLRTWIIRFRSQTISNLKSKIHTDTTRGHHQRHHRHILATHGPILLPLPIAIYIFTKSRPWPWVLGDASAAQLDNQAILSRDHHRRQRRRGYQGGQRRGIQKSWTMRISSGFIGKARIRRIYKRLRRLRRLWRSAVRVLSWRVVWMVWMGWATTVNLLLVMMVLTGGMVF